MAFHGALKMRAKGKRSINQRSILPWLGGSVEAFMPHETSAAANFLSASLNKPYPLFKLLPHFLLLNLIHSTTGRSRFCPHAFDSKNNTCVI